MIMHWAQRVRIGDLEGSLPILKDSVIPHVFKAFLNEQLVFFQLFYKYK